MTVFVTDGNQRSALAIVRALGRRGVTAIVGDEQPVSLASTSRHCARRITYPSPYTNREGFERFLLDFVAREHVDVLLPVTDVTTHSVCAQQDRLSAHTALAVPPFDAFEIVTNKGRLVEYAASLASRFRAPIVSMVSDRSSRWSIGWSIRPWSNPSGRGSGLTMAGCPARCITPPAPESFACSTAIMSTSRRIRR